MMLRSSTSTTWRLTGGWQKVYLNLWRRSLAYQFENRTSWMVENSLQANLKGNCNHTYGFFVLQAGYSTHAPGKLLWSSSHSCTHSASPHAYTRSRRSCMNSDFQLYWLARRSLEMVFPPSSCQRLYWRCRGFQHHGCQENARLASPATVQMKTMNLEGFAVINRQVVCCSVR